MGSLWGHYGVLRGLKGVYRVLMGPLWGLYGVNWGLWGPNGVLMGSIGVYGDLMGSLWGQLAFIGSLWGPYGCNTSPVHKAALMSPDSPLRMRISHHPGPFLCVLRMRASCRERMRFSCHLQRMRSTLSLFCLRSVVRMR